MAEYYAVLKRAVRAHGAHSAEERRAIYEKARSAIIDRLKVIDPPLAPSEITSQQSELDEAIRRLESEAAAGEGQDERHSRFTEREPVQTITSNPEPLPQQSSSLSPQDTFRRALQGAQTRGAAADDSATRAAATEARDRETAEQTGDQAQRLQLESRAETERGGFSFRHPAKSHDDWRPRETAVDRPSEPRPGRNSASRLPERRHLDDPDEKQALPASVRRPRLPATLLIILIVALISGAGVVSWLQRADSSAGAEARLTDGLAPDSLPAPPDIGPKHQDRLADRVRPDSASRVLGESDTRGLFAPPDASSVPTIGAIPDAPLATSGAQPARQAAILYEEPLEPGVASSSLVETVITTRPDFLGRGIRSVPRIVFRADEKDRGEPLIGAAAEVADGAFWIALSAAEADIVRNLQLLKERSWIDLPLVYETGQRAILAFEKGTEGTQVFEDAFAAWDAGEK